MSSRITTTTAAVASSSRVSRPATARLWSAAVPAGPAMCTLSPRPEAQGRQLLRLLPVVDHLPGSPSGHYRRPRAGLPQQFTLDVSGEELAEGGQFVRRVLVGPVQDTSDIEDCRKALSHGSCASRGGHRSRSYSAC